MARKPDLVPLQKAAATYGVSRVTLHRYIKDGKLQAFGRAGDRQTYLDSAEVRRLFSFQPVAGQPATGKGRMEEQGRRRK
jgi:hypothetical protein